MKFSTFLVVIIACAAGLGLGCKPAGSGSNTVADSQADGHDHEGSEEHEHPKSLKEAGQVLADLYSKIKPAFETGDPDAAHGELHEIAHLLDEDIPELIKKESTLDADTKTKLEGTINTLFDAFQKLDDVLHGGPEIEFAPIDATISTALEELKGLTK